MLLPNLFLSVGAMKTGTTWLYGVLNKHPDIYFSYEKEVHYFAHCHTDQIKLNDAARLQRFKQAFQHTDPAKARAAVVRQKLLWYGNYLAEPVNDSWYANLFSFRQRQMYCADFSNLYCHLEKDGWDHVKSVAANVKVIYLMRDPVARLWSHIRFHLHVTGRFEELKSWGPGDYRRFAQQPFIWSNGEYAAAVARLRANLSDRQLKVAFVEDIHRDSRAWLHGLEAFLGASHFDFPEATLSKRIYESPQAQMPAFFPALFAAHAEEQAKALRQLGLAVPAQWGTG